jgi:hypothetical protein
MERFVVVYFDTNGCGRVVGEPNDFEKEESAEGLLTEIRQSHTNPTKSSTVSSRTFPVKRSRH